MATGESRSREDLPHCAKVYTIMLLLFRLLICLCVLWRGDSLLNNQETNGGALQNLLRTVGIRPSTEPIPLTQQQKAEQTLQRLNMTRNLEPKPFSIEPSALPAIVGTSLPVRARYHLKA